MPSLPKEYKAAVFESKGAPLTFKQVKLEQPKDGEVGDAAPDIMFPQPTLHKGFPYE